MKILNLLFVFIFASAFQGNAETCGKGICRRDLNENRFNCPADCLADPVTISPSAGSLVTQLGEQTTFNVVLDPGVDGVQIFFDARLVATNEENRLAQGPDVPDPMSNKTLKFVLTSGRDLNAGSHQLKITASYLGQQFTNMSNYDVAVTFDGKVPVNQKVYCNGPRVVDLQNLHYFGIFFQGMGGDAGTDYHWASTDGSLAPTATYEMGHGQIVMLFAPQPGKKVILVENSGQIGRCDVEVVGTPTPPALP